MASFVHILYVCVHVCVDGASVYSLSLSSTGPEAPARAQSGVEPFEPPPDTSITVSANVGFVGEFVMRSGPNTVVQELEAGAVEGAMAENEENRIGWHTHAACAHTHTHTHHTSVCLC